MKGIVDVEELFQKQCKKCHEELNVDEVNAEKGEAKLSCSGDGCGLSYEFRRKRVLGGLRSKWVMVKVTRTPGVKSVQPVEKGS